MVDPMIIILIIGMISAVFGALLIFEPERLKIHSGKSGRPTKPNGKPTACL